MSGTPLWVLIAAGALVAAALMVAAIYCMATAMVDWGVGQLADAVDARRARDRALKRLLRGAEDRDPDGHDDPRHDREPARRFKPRSRKG